MHVIADIFHVDVEFFVWPAGSLSSVLLSVGSQTLHTSFNGHIRIHFAEGFGVAGEAGFQYLEGQNSCC